MSAKLLALYFLIGGIAVAVATYLGHLQKFLLAAFMASLPHVIILTLCTIYLSSGTGAVASYLKGILILLPALLVFVIAMIWLLPRLGLVFSLSISVFVYLAIVFGTAKLAGS